MQIMMYLMSENNEITMSFGFIYPKIIIEKLKTRHVRWSSHHTLIFVN